MQPIRTWTIDGDCPLTITLHRPAVTLRYGDGPEVELTPTQVEALGSRMLEAEDFFDTAEPEVLKLTPPDPESTAGEHSGVERNQRRPGCV